MKKVLSILGIVFSLIFLASISSVFTGQEIFDKESVAIYQISPSVSELHQAYYIHNAQLNMNNQISSYLSNNINTSSYLILTSEELLNSIYSSNFIPWKESLGYNLTVITLTDPLIQEHYGTDTQQKIREFLRTYYIRWNISYLLIIGDITSIPMRYCYPNPLNHRFDIFDWTSGEVPTDYYYADLSYSDNESWDKDKDGYHGEYGQDTPDFYPEIYVGRIPTSNPEDITYTLNKIVRFEQKTGAWKHHALNGGAFFYFNNEDSSGQDSMDGAIVSSYIEKDIMSNWTIHHYSEQEGLETSTLKWDVLNEKNFIDDWREGMYSIVNWQGHGWTDRVARKVWTTDDGDHIPESNEIQWPNMISRSSLLDDDYPSIVTAISCYVGCPERDPHTTGNIGIDLLSDSSYGAAVAVVASARSPYGAINWPNSPGGSDQIIYEFNKNVIRGKMAIGEALYQSKYVSNQYYGWDHYAEYIDMFTFNLYGDPSMILEYNNQNHPPLKPNTPEGNKIGKPGMPYDYTTTAFDEDDDEMWFKWDWDDGNCSGWLGPYTSRGVCEATHTWSKKDDYQIKVKAKDEHGYESEWSDPLAISMPKIHTYNPIIQLVQKILALFPFLQSQFYKK